jgi:cell division protein FtsW (lipid II flippase)
MPLFWLKIKDYQRVRITSVLLQNDALRAYLETHPERWDWFRPRRVDPGEWHRELTQWESGAGYQLVHSKAAIGSGALWGRGWGEGVFVEHDFLPLKHNDFIFAMIAHQWGLVGGLLLIFCYVVIVVLGFDVATLTNDPFGRLLAVGLSTLIAVQTLTNLCVTVGLGPITGVTLPFVSAGGSSLVSSFLCVGLLISVAHYRPMLIAKKPFEFDEEADRFQDVQA